MKWHRRFLGFALATALMVGVGCTSGDSPTEVQVQTAGDEPSQLLGGLLGGDGLLGGVGDAVDGVVEGVGEVAGTAVGGVLNVTDLLTCTPQRHEVTRKTIGPRGGEIKVGNHRLVIPRGALTRHVRIKAEQMRGSVNSVRFSPHGLQFEKPATLTMSYRNCVVVLLPKHIVYTDEKLNILELLRSVDLFKKKTVTSPIDHFSRYAVAY